MNRRDFVTLLGGAALAWPLAARAQQQAMKVIGYLSPAWPRLAAAAPYWAAFRQGLGETGYVEGRNLAIEYRYAEGDRDRLPALAADLVGRKVDVIVAAVSARTAKEATSTIPIVFQEARDPVEAGLVASLARPGGNLTGFAGFNLELTPKRLELLTELVPQARVIALLADPTTPFSEPMISDVQEAARMKGVQLAVLKAGTESEIDAAFASLGQLRAGGLLVGGSVFFAIRREQIFALASHHAVPAMYDARGYVADGGLISYGNSGAEIGLGVGRYVGRILNGAKPADLPVQQPTKFELVVNLKTARTLGLTIPQSISARADEVIE